MSSEQYFDKVADQWDHMRKSFFSDEVREKALAAANVKPGKLAADIGAGTGFITEGLVQNGLRVIAVDQSGAMLEEMKKSLNHLIPLNTGLGILITCPLKMKPWITFSPICISTMSTLRRSR